MTLCIRMLPEEYPPKKVINAFACAKILRLIFDLLLLHKVHWNRTAWPPNRLVISCCFLYIKVLQQPFMEPGSNV